MSHFRTRRVRARHVPARVWGKPLSSRVLNAPVNDNAQAEHEAPFDPPDDLEDIFGAADAIDEDTVFAEDTANDTFTTQIDDPEFDAPDLNDAAADESDAEPVTSPEALPLAAADEEPPFDPPMVGDDGFDDLEPLELVQPEPLELTHSEPPPKPAPVLEPLPPPLASFATSRPAPVAEIPSSERPLPAISIFASYDRPEVGKLLHAFAADRRASRAEIVVERGGVDAAAVQFETGDAANLIIVDTNLRRAEMLAGLERLRPAIAQGAKLIVLGALNDVAILRELSHRGVSEYIVPPIGLDAFMRTVCGLYAETDTSRVIAVIGARGGVGASSVAHNVAWSIAERQEMGATLVDLDLCFGTAAFAFKQGAQRSVTDLLGAVEKPHPDTDRLQVLTAPAALEPSAAIDEEVMHILIERARRTSPYVVLDLPHAWTPWARQTLIEADDVILVAAPDLASLRNAKSMIDVLTPARGGKSAPRLTLSMVGVPKRPEILAKDFAEAVGIKPTAAVAFDPELFGVAEISGRMIGDVAPDSKVAATFDALAAAITGHPPCRRSASGSSLRAVSAALAEGGVSPLLLTQEAAAASDYLGKAMRAAEDDFVAQKTTQRQTTKRTLGRTLGLAACLAAVAAVGAWQWQVRSPTAQAITPAPAPASAAPAMNAEDQYRAGLDLLDAGRAEDGARAVLRAAQAGFAPAQYRLAKLYEHGEGVSVDADAARLWTERAAAGGHRRAMHDLGVYFAQGDGVTRDDAAAFRWFRQAAEFGVADSQYNLGVLYQEGRGVAADPSEALFWFLTAAAQGDEEAVARAATLSAQLPALDVERARARAQSFQPRASANVAAEPRGTAT